MTDMRIILGHMNLYRVISCLSVLVLLYFRGRVESSVCQIREFLGNLKKYLSKRADCMILYNGNSFLGAGKIVS